MTRCVITVVSLVLEYQNVLCHGSMSFNYGYIYMTVLNSVSMGLAMFTLIAYYLPTRTEISHSSPVSQFMSIKFVVFFQFALRMLFNILVGYDFLEKSEYWTAAQESILLQSFSTVVEMMIASIWHLFAFKVVAFETEHSRLDAKFAILDVIRSTDLLSEIKTVYVFMVGHAYSVPTQDYHE